jgi:hypothetical protein
MSNPINNLFENILNENEYVDQHNFLVAKLAPELVGELTINHTDSMDEMKKKRKKAKEKIKNYGFFYPLYPRVIKTGEQPAEEPTPPTDSGDTGGETGAGEGGVDEIKPHRSMMMNSSIMKHYQARNECGDTIAVIPKKFVTTLKRLRMTVLPVTVTAKRQLRSTANQK